MKTQHLFLAASAVVLASATLAIAGETETKRVIVTKTDDGGKKTCEMRIMIGGPPAFGDIDTDHNGSITAAEYDAFHKDHHPGGPGMPRPDMDGPPPPPPGGPGMPKPGMDGPPPPPPGGEGCGGMTMMDDMGPGPDGPGGPMERHRVVIMQKGDPDSDKDGKVTLDEFISPIKKHFDEMDANHDGVLSGAELPEHGPPPPPAGN